MENYDLDAHVACLENELAAVRAREQDLADFIENASLAVHAVSADGRIAWANQAELDLLGYTRDEYIGHHIAEFHVDAPVIDDILKRLTGKETLRNYEARLRCKDGSTRHVLISSNVRWKGDEFIHTRCFTRDISERKRYEQRLLAQYAVGRILAGASSLAVAAPELLQAICDHLGWRVGLLWMPSEGGGSLTCASYYDRPTEKGGGFGYLCRDVNFAPGIGLPGRVWSGEKPYWITDLGQDENFPRLRLAAEHGLRSAVCFPIMLGGRVCGVMEFLSEDTRSPDSDLLQMGTSLGYQVGEFLERTRAQQQLAEREESYRVLAETASDGIVTIDAASRILFANSAAGKIFGYTSEELTGSDLTRLIPENVREAYRASLGHYLQTGERRLAGQAIQLIGEHRDGYEIPIEVSFGEYKQANKHVFVGIIRDTSERKRLDESLRQTAKLESLGVLAGGIAHDFNNLLTGILGNVGLALETVEEAGPAKTVLQNAIEASERAAHLTQQLLAYAGKGRFLIEPTDISALVREISALVRSSIPKHVTLRLDLQQPLPLVEADVAQIQQLVMNLVINAAEAIPESRRGTVLVMTRGQDMAARDFEGFDAGDMAAGNYVSITVHDNGLGMDQATITKIFDPFFTTKFAGRGLGLAAALGIVRGHKGALKVFSTPGEGSTFKVLLPASAVARNKPAPAPAKNDLDGQGNVLVVDDEPIVRKIAAAGLERYGYQVTTAENGRDGVQRFRELHPQLTAVVLDMTMPVMNGDEAFDCMQQINPRVPVILSSGYNEVEAIRRFTGKGLAGFIQKPYTAAALAEKIKAIIRDSRRFAAKLPQ